MNFNMDELNALLLEKLPQITQAVIQARQTPSFEQQQSHHTTQSTIETKQHETTQQETITETQEEEEDDWFADDVQMTDIELEQRDAIVKDFKSKCFPTVTTELSFNNMFEQCVFKRARKRPRKR